MFQLTSAEHLALISQIARRHQSQAGVAGESSLAFQNSVYFFEFPCAFPAG